MEEGFGGIFRGVVPALFTIPVFWGFYWPIYENLKQHYAVTFPSLNSHSTHLLSAVTAGGISDIISNPFWVTRTRIQAQILHQSNAKSGMLEMIKLIYKEEGILAFYKGLGASFLGLTHVAIHFPLCRC